MQECYNFFFVLLAVTPASGWIFDPPYNPDVVPGTIDPLFYNGENSYGWNYSQFIDNGWYVGPSAYPGINTTRWSNYQDLCAPDIPLGSWCGGGIYLPGNLNQYSFTSLGCYYDGTLVVDQSAGFGNWTYIQTDDIYGFEPYPHWNHSIADCSDDVDSCLFSDGYNYPLRYWHLWSDGISQSAPGAPGESPELCIRACASYGYKYAAPFNSLFCACDNFFNVSSIPAEGQATPDDKGGANCYDPTWNEPCTGSLSNYFLENCGGIAYYWVYEYNGTGRPTDSPYFQSLSASSSSSLSLSRSLYYSSKSSYSSYVSASQYAASTSRSIARSLVSSVDQSIALYRSSLAAASSTSRALASASKSNARSMVTSSKSYASYSRSLVDFSHLSSLQVVDSSKSVSRSVSASLAAYSRSQSSATWSSSKLSVSNGISQSRYSASLSRSVADSLQSSLRYSSSLSRSSWRAYVSSSRSVAVAAKSAADASWSTSRLLALSSLSSASLSRSSYQSYLASSQLAASVSQSLSASAYSSSVSAASAASAAAATFPSSSSPSSHHAGYGYRYFDGNEFDSLATGSTLTTSGMALVSTSALDTFSLALTSTTMTTTTTKIRTTATMAVGVINGINTTNN